MAERTDILNGFHSRPRNLDLRNWDLGQSSSWAPLIGFQDCDYSKLVPHRLLEIRFHDRAFEHLDYLATSARRYRFSFVQAADRLKFHILDLRRGQSLLFIQI